jgi:SAM-dependent MidA family methyltransferase
MQLCLYCPVYGYYEAEQDTVGRKGDYFTSVSVGNIFGRLLAWQFADWLSGAEAIPSGSIGNAVDGVCIIEAGAQDGKLAKDILTWLRVERAQLFEKLNYVIAEPSSRRKEWQEKQLADFAEKMTWIASLEDGKKAGSPVSNATSCIIFSNELLDSFPIHRYGWDAKKREWFEWGVTIRNNKFSWTRLSAPGTHFLPELTDHLPDGFTFETAPAAEHWWTDAAQLLQRGKLVTIDYGFEDDEQNTFRNSRAGAIRAYRNHQQGSDLLANPGEQDLTADVNFQAIRHAGEKAGLRTESLLMQEQFFTNIFEQAWKDPNFSRNWGPEDTRQFKTLIHPEHLGRRFRVLVQARG